MKKNIIPLILLFILGCSNDDKTIDIVTNNIERGAVLRNVERIQSNFIVGDFGSRFGVEIEEQDEEEGELLDFVRVYSKYIDRTPENGNNSTLETVVKDILASDFEPGPFNLPRTIIEVRYDEVVNSQGLDFTSIRASDQFEIRLEVFLTDGRSFSNDSGSASILTDYCFFKSPYRYVINMIEPIPDTEYTGTYFYEILNDNVNEIPLNASGVINVSSTYMTNVRKTGFVLDGLEFTIAGDKIYPKIYQSFNGFCRESGPHVLTGPSENSFGQLDSQDDTVFDLDFVIGYEGWDGQGGSNVQEVRIRFTKQ